jgi:L-ascorbate metabolism protein UlaG (beta-lactamase superfamily)
MRLLRATGVCIMFACVATFAQRPATDTLPAAGGDITIVPIAHATVEILQGAHVILVDPALEPDPSQMPPPPPPPPALRGTQPGDISGRGSMPAPPPPPPGRGGRSAPPPMTVAQRSVRFSGLKPPTLILVTHEHEDHFDREAIAAFSTPATKVVLPSVVSSQVSGAVAIANGETKMADGVTIEAIPSYNLRPDPQFGDTFHPKGRGNGYVVTVGGKRLFFAGDTSCTPEIKALKNIDVAFLPMNLPFTMSSADAIECAKAFRPKIAYPYHYQGPERGGPAAFAAALEGSGIEVRVRDWYMSLPAQR